MRQGKRIATAMVAPVVITTLLILAGAAHAQPTPLSVQPEAVPLVRAQAHQVTTTVESAPVVGQTVHSASRAVGPVVTSVEGDAAPIAAAMRVGAPSAVRGVDRGAHQIVGGVQSSSGQVVVNVRGSFARTTGGATRAGAQVMSSGRQELTAVTGAQSTLTPDAGQVMPAEVAGASALTQAGAHNLIAGSSAFYIPLTSIIQAGLSRVPVLPGLVAQVVDLVNQLRVFIGSEIGALTSQLVQDRFGAPRQTFAALQVLAPAEVHVTAPTVRSARVSAPMPAFGPLEAFAASVAASADHADRPAGVASAGRGSGGHGFASGTSIGTRAGAVASGGFRPAFGAPGGDGAFSLAGPLHAGVQLPIMLLLLTLLIPASWRLRLAASRYRPVIFAFPLERPG